MITLDNLTVTYRQHPALHHVSAVIPRGSLCAVIGPNGAGKSTLLKALMGLIQPSGGRVHLAVPLQRVAYLPQVADIDRSFPMPVLDCVLLGAWSQIGPWGGVDAALLERAHAALHALGLDGFEQRPIGSLSMGQLQRVLFARLMLQQAELLLLDEPFTALDSRTTATLLDLIDQWHAQGRTVVAVLHDDAQVLAHFDHSLLLARECVACGPTEHVLTPTHLARARALAEAWDDHAELCARDPAAA
ncbi:MAG: zinc ABC transporter ATP-binding protein AztA [Rhodoferax sp.]